MQVKIGEKDRVITAIPKKVTDQIGDSLVKTINFLNNYHLILLLDSNYNRPQTKLIIIIFLGKPLSISI